MPKNFVFRALPQSGVGDADQLFERVIGLATELALDGALEDFNPMRVSRWSDSSGPALVMSIEAKPGWHFHQQSLITRYGLGCQAYV